MTPITVIDALMGEGKTQYVFNMMREHPDDKYIYISINLGETDRCVEACPDLDFHSPNTDQHGRKFYHLAHLIEDGNNIASTHQLFRLMTPDLYDTLKGQGYTLVIDEALDVVEQYSLHPDALKALEKSGAVYVDDKKHLRWNHEEFPRDRKLKGLKYDFSEVASLCDNGNLVKARDGVLLWKFPASFLDVFERVFVCTYMFEGQVMADYFKANDVPYELLTLSDGGLMPLAETDNTGLKRKLADLITIDMDPYRNSLGYSEGRGYPLSKSWYQQRAHGALKDETGDLKQLKNSTAAFFKQHGEGAATNMWTCFKEYMGKMKGKGYAKVPLRDWRKRGQKSDPRVNFVAMNSKATNDYAHKQALAYLVDRHQSPMVLAYFQEFDIPVRADLFALTELIQWIWRSRIRNAEPINLFIPSHRMRMILTNWIACSDAEIVAGRRLDEEPIKMAA